MSALDDVVNGSGYGNSTHEEREAARAELAALRAYSELMRGLLAQAVRDHRAELAALRDEVERLRGLVRSAYLEGWREGNSVGVSQGQEWSGPHTKSDPEGDWEASDSRAALEAKP